MGCSYTNVTLRGPSQEELAAALQGRDAYVSPTANGVIVIFDAASEDQSEAVITTLAATRRSCARHSAAGRAR